MAAPIRVGVCSWADETLTKVWYPKGVTKGEHRLRYYAERFDTVEANSTYYRLPDPAMVFLTGVQGDTRTLWTTRDPKRPGSIQR